ncbi:MAG: hypothetical protein ABI602_03970 [Candidatus Saccharibacteria bacterium]
MPDLQTTFYLVGIIFMSLMLLIMLVLVVAVVMIRAKIVAIHRQIEARLDDLTGWAGKGSAVLGAIKTIAHSQHK